MSDFVSVAEAGALVGGTAGAVIGGAIGGASALGTAGAVGTCVAVAGGAVGGAVIGGVAGAAAALLGFLAYKAINYISEALCTLLSGLVNCMIETGQKFVDLIKRAVGHDKEVLRVAYRKAAENFSSTMKKEIKGKMNDKDIEDEALKHTEDFLNKMTELTK